MAGRSLGFIGVGKMGFPMASRLLAAGNSLTVYDVNTDALESMVQKGAKRASSAAEVASKEEVVLVSLPRPETVEQVVLGTDGVASGTKRRLVVDLSTTGPTKAAAVAKGLAEHGATLIDAPISGGVGGAEKGTLAVMVSGPKADCDALKPVFEVFGKYFYIGDKPGQAQMVKLINNLLSATAMAATAEGVALGVKAGLDPKVLIDVINSGSGKSSASMDKFPKSILPRTFDYGFALGLMTKDVNLCLAEAQALNVPMWIGHAAQQTWTLAMSKGKPEDDFTEIMKHVEALSGVTFGPK